MQSPDLINNDMDSEDSRPQSLLPKLSFVEVSDRLSVMRKQEDTFYRPCGDYVAWTRGHISEEDTLTEADSTLLPVDEECRVKMCEWCYQVIDHCKLRRETVSISMSFLDRYACTNASANASTWSTWSPSRKCTGSSSSSSDSGNNTSSTSNSSSTSSIVLLDRRQYQLAAMTCLYVAIKIFEPPLPLSVVSQLSRGIYSEEEIANMEVEILFTLNWRVSVPTVVGFIYHMVAILPMSIRIKNDSSGGAGNGGVEDDVSKLLDFSQYQAELVVGDYAFITQRASSIALAAIMNAMGVIDGDAFPPSLRYEFLKSISMASNLKPFDGEIEALRAKLHHVFLKSSGHALPLIYDMKWCEYESYDSGKIGARSDNGDIIEGCMGMQLDGIMSGHNFH